MGLVTRQPVATAELGDPLAQDLLGPLQPFLFIAAFETLKELLDQRRDRRAAFGGNDPGMTIGGIVD